MIHNTNGFLEIISKCSEELEGSELKGSVVEGSFDNFKKIKLTAYNKLLNEHVSFVTNSGNTSLLPVVGGHVLKIKICSKSGAQKEIFGISNISGVHSIDDNAYLSSICHTLSDGGALEHFGKYQTIQNTSELEHFMKEL